MKKININVIILSLTLLTISCKEERQFDASGSFEAEEYIISAEGMGVIKQFSIEEGQLLQAGSIVGFIDTTQLYLKKKQLEAQIGAVLSRKPDIQVQIASLEEQIASILKEKERFTKLVKSDAATQKQLDDIDNQYKMLKKQLQAQQSQLSITSDGVTKESVPLRVQMDQIEDQIQKCIIINPITGTVLTRYAKAHETTANGKPLYKIADLSNIILRAYISGDQLPKVRLNQKVKVFTDNGDGTFHETEGVITWISDKAEFTPKTIQTKNERANLVFAIKVSVVNDGKFKIGMYGELNF